MKLNKMNRMRKISLGIMIPFSLIFTSSMVLYTSCGKTSNSTPSDDTVDPAGPSPANVLDPSKSDWKEHFYSEDSGDFAPGTNGDFKYPWSSYSGWEQMNDWLDGTAYDTLDLGTFSSVGENAFWRPTYSGDYVGDPLFLDNDDVHSKIKHIIFSKDICKNIGVNAFKACSSLTSITFPNSLETIFGGSAGGAGSTTNGAFYGCKRLTSINLPRKLNNIGNFCFSYCTSLTSLTMGRPDYVGTAAFMNCSSLTSITASYISRPQWTSDVTKFRDVSSTGSVTNTEETFDSQALLVFLRGFGIPNTGWGSN